MSAKPKYYFMFAHHFPANSQHRDLHVAKFHRVYPDGKTERILIPIYDFTRPFWVTKPMYRKHKDKREFEELKHVQEFYSTQSELINNTMRALGRDGYRRNNRMDAIRSPFVYGLDVDSTAFLKKSFMDRVDGEMLPYGVAGLDTEADTETQELYISTVVFDGKIRTVILEKFLKGIKDPIVKMNALAVKHIPEKFRKEYEIEFIIVKTELDVARTSINFLHEWKPDFLVIWNVLYDIGVFQKVCEKYNFPIEIMFKDPGLPDSDAHFHVKKGPTTKKMASGKESSIPIHQRWNTVKASSSFYITDGMTVFNYVRQGEKLLPGGYGLDNLLTKKLGHGKLKMVETDRIGKEWHEFMQERHPLEYAVYNVWDTLGMVLLEDKLDDLRVSMPALTDMSNFDIFNSGPKKNVDGVLFNALEDEKRVLMTRDREEMKPELSPKEWIVTLPGLFITDKNTDYSIILENNDT